MPSEITETPSIHPRLSHCGIYVQDVGKQVEFYERVLGLVVSDRGVSDRIGSEFAFMTAAAEHHHQVVFISGRAQQGVTTVNQLSFKVSDLEELCGGDYKEDVCWGAKYRGELGRREFHQKEGNLYGKGYVHVSSNCDSDYRHQCPGVRSRR